MTSFTFTELRRVASVYAKYVRVKVRSVRLMENCKRKSGHLAHMHYMGPERGTMCLKPKVFGLERSQQISLIIHELHHLVPTQRRKSVLYPYKLRTLPKHHTHAHKAFKVKADMWSHHAVHGSFKLETFEEAIKAIAAIEVEEN